MNEIRTSFALRDPFSPQLTLSRLMEVIHYDPKTGIFKRKINSRRRPNTLIEAGSINAEGYLYIGIDRRLYCGHRLAWLYVYGIWPTFEIDHRNRIRSDNRILNLREATKAENQHNVGLTKSNTSGYRGVSWNRELSKWCAQIKHQGKIKYLGVYASKEAAASAYATASAQLHTHGLFIKSAEV